MITWSQVKFQKIYKEEAEEAEHGFLKFSLIQNNKVATKRTEIKTLFLLLVKILFSIELRKIKIWY